MHRSLRALVALTLLAAWVAGVDAPAAAQDQSITIRAARVIDGKGKVLQDATIEVRGPRFSRSTGARAR